MSTAAQRVVVIQDATREVSSSAITWALHGLSLKPGDELTLLTVLHQVNNPSTLSFMGAGKLLGIKSKVDSTSMFGANHRIIEEEVARKRKEYEHNEELVKISEQYAMHKIEFYIKVVAGSSPKMIALQASIRLRATWVILDRQMKKDKKYFMEKLSCGISRMKRDNSVEKLRGPKTTETNKIHADVSRSSNVTYDEMLPGPPDEDDLFSLELSPINSLGPCKAISDGEKAVHSGEGPPWHNSWKVVSFSKSLLSKNLILPKTVSSPGNTEASSSSLYKVSCSPLNMQEEEHNIHSQRGRLELGTPNFITQSQNMGHPASSQLGNPEEEQRRSFTNEELALKPAQHQTEEAFEDSICSVCNNRRPKIRYMKDFTYAELQAATDGFSETNFLSEGGFGSVYKGKLRDGLTIAVKQHKNASLQGEKEFKSEVYVLSKARHKNVVMLLGSCSERSHRLLVYEYVCNGSLNQHLSKHSLKPLSWTDRMRIALGAARGLNYLHENNIIHRDMRPSNILVTHDHEPLLGDFGLARTQQGEIDQSSENRVVGTFGYLAPEYAESGKVSTKTDVYSFGVVLLELITGLGTTDRKLEERGFVAWARPLLKERKYPDLIDPRILDSHDVHQLFWMVQVAEKCLKKDPDRRLSMDKVMNTLTSITYGETVFLINDFSPAHSDSFSSLQNSIGSQGEEGIADQESLSAVRSISSSSELFSSEYSAHTFSTKSSSPSTRSKLSSSGKNSKKEKKVVKFRNSRSHITYGEMLH